MNNIKSVIKDILKLLATGKVIENNYSIYKSLLNLIIILILTIILTVLSIIIIMLLLPELDIQPSVENTANNLKHKSLFLTIIFLTVIAPLVEEIGYRLWLRYSPRNIALVITYFSYIFINYIAHNINLISRIFIPISIGISVYSFLIKKYKINNYLHHLILNNPITFFYISVFSFSYMHIFNYKLTTNIYLWAPLIFLPQTMGAITLGYLRLKYGFIYSITVHSLYNLLTCYPNLV